MRTLGLPLGLPPDASAQGPQIDQLLGIVHWFMLVLFVGWGAFFVYCLIRFRRKANPVADPAGLRGRFPLLGEVAVVLVEVLLLVIFAVPIWARRVDFLPDRTRAVEVRVVAEQFAWNVHYPGRDGVFGRGDLRRISPLNPLGLDPADPAGRDDVVAVNQLHLPVGRPAIVYLSTKDVIHSFFLPVMRVKQDAIPGQVIPLWFQPVRTGSWEIACAQLCGASHYRMKGFLTVEGAGEFQGWLDGRASGKH
jgi:cytochrome c oxidase subunit II